MYHDDASKLVVVLHRQLEPGRAMNALAHAVAGLVARLSGSARIEFLDYQTKEGWASYIARSPIIVLRSDNSHRLQELHQRCLAASLPTNAFLHTMLGVSASDQLEKTQAATAEELEYWAVALYGEADRLRPLTKRFSLY